MPLICWSLCNLSGVISAVPLWFLFIYYFYTYWPSLARLQLTFIIPGLEVVRRLLLAYYDCYATTHLSHIYYLFPLYLLVISITCISKHRTCLFRGSFLTMHTNGWPIGKDGSMCSPVPIQHPPGNAGWWYVKEHLSWFHVHNSEGINWKRKHHFYGDWNIASQAHWLRSLQGDRACRYQLLFCTIA